jgi:hypothetical protein
MPISKNARQGTASIAAACGNEEPAKVIGRQ